MATLTAAVPNGRLQIQIIGCDCQFMLTLLSCSFKFWTFYCNFYTLFLMMAQRNQVVGTISPNQENLNSKHVVKQMAIPKTQLPIKRAALGEVGNKLHVHAQVQGSKDTNKHTSGTITTQQKTDKVMKPPQALPKKKTTAVPKKEGAEKLVVSSKSSKPLLRQESILKHFAQTKAFSSTQLAIIDPDESSKQEPQMVTEYLTDIFQYLRDLEIKFPIKEKLLEEHNSTPTMRTILVNWLVDVHDNFKLCIETLHLCVALLDRYLQINKNVGKETLQLVGTSALLVACKYEEMYIPELSDFIFVCDYTFSGKQILQMEINILSKLEFNLGRPLSIHFLRRYSKIAQARSDHHNLGKYLLELILLEYRMCHIRPSIQAAAACCLSMAVLNEVMDPSKVWTPTLVHYTTYKYSDFKAVLVDLAHVIVKTETTKYDNVKKKYASSKQSKISLNAKLRGPLIKKLTSSPLKK